jgi:hypothetical protein
LRISGPDVAEVEAMKAIKAFYPDAMCWLARAYLSGEGVERQTLLDALNDMPAHRA